MNVTVLMELTGVMAGSQKSGDKSMGGYHLVQHPQLTNEETKPVLTLSQPMIGLQCSSSYLTLSYNILPVFSAQSLLPILYGVF